MRKMLVAVAGLTPQIITETLYYYAIHATPQVRFDAIHVLTTGAGAEVIRNRLMGASGALASLCSEYDLPLPHFDETSIHIIGGEQPLEDIRDQDDNAMVAEEIAALIRRLSEDAQCALYCSIAGGRKTMGVYLALAMQIYGRDQDRLSHVLVNPEFELVDGFFYPPKTPRDFQDRRGNSHNSKNAVVDLAEIPFVSARKFVSERSLKRYQDAIIEARRNIGLADSQPEVRVDLVNRALFINGNEIELTNRQLAWYAAVLWAKASCQKPVCDRCHDCYRSDDAALEADAFGRFLEIYDLLNPCSITTDNLIEKYREALVIQAGSDKTRQQARDRAYEHLKNLCRENRSRVNKELPLQAVHGLPWLLIQPRGERGDTRYGVALDRENIHFVWPPGSPGKADFGLDRVE